jgi:uncharacterized membrane protein
VTTYTRPVPTASRWPLAAALGAGAALVLTAIGTFKDMTSASEAWREYAITAAIILVVTALVFGFVVRTATPATAGRRCLVLGILALVSIVVFWLGLPPVLAAASLACAALHREEAGQWGAAAAVGAAASALAVVVSVVAAFAG